MQDPREQAIVELVSKGQVKVPPYPAVAMQIERLVGSGDYGLDQVTKLVQSDQVLAADVLRAANSAFYSRGQVVASLSAAVSRIGAKDVGRVALASGLGAHALRAGALSALRRKVWTDALASALLCQALAKGRGLAPDVAFSAGLLHDFGKVVALACVEELVQRGTKLPARSAEEWEEIVERFHVELGVVMAARWELPPVIADVISLHHADQVGAAAEPGLVEVVAAVDEVVHQLGDRTHLSEEDLGAASLLLPAECALLSRTLEQLPGFVASFETGEALRPAGPSLVARPAPPPPPEARGPAVPVVLTAGGKAHLFKVLGVASTHFMASGPVALPENLLLQMEVQSKPPLKGFASVKLSWPEGGAFTLLVQPYALSGEALTRWKALVAGAEKA
jgi:putative nucleotidyltransferase with HDIG domain